MDPAWDLRSVQSQPSYPACNTVYFRTPLVYCTCHSQAARTAAGVTRSKRRTTGVQLLVFRRLICLRLRFYALEIRQTATCHWRSEGSAGVRAAPGAGRHLLGAANGRKLFFFNSRENSDCIISYVFACNKNKALQLQSVPILSILGYNINLYFKQALQFPKPKTKGSGSVR